MGVEYHAYKRVNVVLRFEHYLHGLEHILCR